MGFNFQYYPKSLCCTQRRCRGGQLWLGCRLMRQWQFSRLHSGFPTVGVRDGKVQGGGKRNKGREKYVRRSPGCYNPIWSVGQKEPPLILITSKSFKFINCKNGIILAKPSRKYQDSEYATHRYPIIWESKLA